MPRISKHLLPILLLAILSGCSSVPTVPVTEAWRQTITDETNYTVQPGDTLYSIAWNYGLDYRRVAAMNGISTSYKITVGQKLKLVPPGGGQPQPVVLSTEAPQQAPKVVKICPAPAPVAPTNQAQPAVAVNTPTIAGITNNAAGIVWTWPAHGKVVDNFTQSGLNKGIDILGANGSSVLAAAQGKVVYDGNGLRGYGNLIIIKHNDMFLSAYAHNQKILVQEGQMVKMGQVIALMGSTEAKQVELHFEIRKAGKPVDPMKYLPEHC